MNRPGTIGIDVRPDNCSFLKRSKRAASFRWHTSGKSMELRTVVGFHRFVALVSLFRCNSVTEAFLQSRHHLSA